MAKFKKNRTRRGGHGHRKHSKHAARQRAARQRAARERARERERRERERDVHSKKMEVAAWFQKFSSSQFFNSIFDYFDENTGKPIENKDKFVVNDEIKESIDWDKFIKAEANLKLIQKELKMDDETIAMMGTYATNVDDNHLYISNDDAKALHILSKDPFLEEEKKAFTNYFTNIPWGKQHLKEIEERANRDGQLENEVKKLKEEMDNLNPNNNKTEGVGTHNCEPQTLKMPMSCKLTKCPKWRAKVDACKSWEEKTKKHKIKEQELNNVKTTRSLLNKLKSLGIIVATGGKRKKRTRRRKKRKRKKTKTKKRRKRRR